MAIVKLSKDNFEAEVLQAPGTVLIDFWASWCGPCRMLSPIVDEIAQENLPGVRIGKVNIDEEPDLAKQYQVMSIPMLIVMRDGKVVTSSVGVKSKPAILQMLSM